MNMQASSIFNQIGFDNIRGDTFGGVTAAVVALPMALAFGVASGAGPEAGLYGAVLVGLFAALFGATPTLISEPTGPMTVVFTAVLASLIATNPDQGLAMAFTVVILAGVLHSSQAMSTEHSSPSHSSPSPQTDTTHRSSALAPSP